MRILEFMGTRIFLKCYCKHTQLGKMLLVVDAIFKIFTVLSAIMEFIGILDLCWYKWFWSMLLNFAEEFTSLLSNFAPQLYFKVMRIIRLIYAVGHYE